jgi:hypothetical protein
LSAVSNQVRTISRIVTLSLVVCAYLVTSFAGLTHEISHATADARLALYQSGFAPRSVAGGTIVPRTSTHLDTDRSGGFCFFCTFSFGSLAVETPTATTVPVDDGIGKPSADTGSPTVHSLHRPSLRAPPFRG